MSAHHTMACFLEHLHLTAWCPKSTALPHHLCPLPPALATPAAMTAQGERQQPALHCGAVSCSNLLRLPCDTRRVVALLAPTLALLIAGGTAAGLFMQKRKSSGKSGKGKRL